MVLYMVCLLADNITSSEKCTLSAKEILSRSVIKYSCSCDFWITNIFSLNANNNKKIHVAKFSTCTLAYYKDKPREAPHGNEAVAKNLKSFVVSA